MREALEFLSILIVLAMTASWYVFNLQKGAQGQRGLLAVRGSPSCPKGELKRSYSVKSRIARSVRERQAATGITDEATAPAFRENGADALMRRKFRRQDEARYRVKDKASMIRNKDKPPSETPPEH